MFKLDLEKAERHQRSNCQHPLDHRKSKRVPEKNIYFCFIDYAKAFDYINHNKLWKILKEMGIPDHLTCLLRNLYAGQEATVRTGHGTTDCFQIGKGVCQGCILSPCFFNFYAECCCCCQVVSVMSHFFDSMDCSLPGSSVHGILQARKLEWVAMPSSRGSSHPMHRTHAGKPASPALAGRFFIISTTWEALFLTHPIAILFTLYVSL